MITFFKKRSTMISVLLLLAALISVWQFPSTGLMLGVLLLLFSLFIASSAIVEKHRKAYLQGKITRGVFVRNTVVEIFGILLAVILAGLLGRTIAEIATEQISSDLTKLIAGMVIGLLAGMGIGLLVKRTWGKFVRS